jgi:hypothetical protein
MKKTFRNIRAENINHGSKNVAAFFFATRLSKNEGKCKDINKNLPKLKEKWCSRLFFLQICGKK